MHESTKEFEIRPDPTTDWETYLDKPNRLLSGSQFVNSLYCIVLYCNVLYCIVLYCIVLYYIVLYCLVYQINICLNY